MMVVGGCTFGGVILIILISVTAYTKLKKKGSESDSPNVELDNNLSSNNPAPSYAVPPVASKYVSSNNERNDLFGPNKTNNQIDNEPPYPLTPLQNSQLNTDGPIAPSDMSMSELPDIPPPPYSNSHENTLSPPVDDPGI